MDDHGVQMGRRQVLALGLAGAAAGVVGAVAEPASAGAAASYSGEPLVGAAVDLLIEWKFSASGSMLQVSGTVGGKPVEAKGDLYGTPSTVTGLLAGERLDAILTLKDQVPHGSGYTTTARLAAAVGTVAFVLDGVFTLDSNYSWVDGLITGSDHGLEVALSASPPPSDQTGSAANLSGTFAGTPIDIKANAPLGNKGSVIGSVGQGKVDLLIRQVASQSSSGRLSGVFSGPAELLAVIVGAVAFFAI